MKKTVCLNMIVKDESAVIQRCLESVKGLIDYWVIVDTGSSDGTQNIIRGYLRDVPGELHEQPWVNFAHNRNAALQLAQNRSDYLLFIDADERLEYAKSFAWPPLDKDYYAVNVEVEGGMRIHRILLVNHRFDWKWVGVLHESVVCSQAKNYEILQGIVNRARQDGHRSQDPDKFIKDAQVLEKALKENPQDSQSLFYLAFSCDVAGEYAKALKNYQKRAAIRDSEQIVFYCLYRIAWLQEKLKMSADLVIQSYCSAYLARPTRAEPLLCLSNFYVRQNNPLLGYLVSKFALAIPLSNDTVLVDVPVYSYRLLEQAADCSYLLGRWDETRRLIRQLLARKDLPKEDRTKIEHLQRQINPQD